VGLEVVDEFFVFGADAPVCLGAAALRQLANKIVAALDRAAGGLRNGHGTPFVPVLKDGLGRAQGHYFRIDLIKFIRKYKAVTALQASSSLTALADPTRQRIVEMLAAGALSSGDIAGRFKLSPPAISQHLKTLKQARLVSVRTDKQKRIYSLDPAGVAEVSEWVARIQAFWNPRLDALEAALKRDGK
jgi:DNA-binding transcriptional ArsR family regulator